MANGEKKAESAQAQAAQQAAGEVGEAAGKRYSIGSLIPGKDDPRRPPAWLSRALAMAVLAVFIGVFVWRSWASVKGVVVDLVVCLFIALAMEPAVVWLVRHGWRRPAASITMWLAVLLVCAALIGLFGEMFVSQLAGLASKAPDLYSQLSKWVSANTPWRLPSDIGSLLSSNLRSSLLSSLAGTAMGVTGQLVSFFTSLMIVLFVTYYMSAYMPRMRQTICTWLKPAHQRRFLVIWTVVQGQVSSFLSSRIILALISSVCMSLYMVSTKVPYWLPLAVLYAIVSQFVPMVGGIIGAILPVIVVWSTQGFRWALFIVIYTTVYQQIENMLIAPKVQQKTMAVPPAVGLIAVFAFSDLFGVLGAFLALPIVASLQVIFNAYTMGNELVDSPLLYDPKPQKTTKLAKMANAGEDFGEILSTRAIRKRRVARGSSGRLLNETERQLLEAERLLDQGAGLQDGAVDDGASAGTVTAGGTGDSKSVRASGHRSKKAARGAGTRSSAVSGSKEDRKDAGRRMEELREKARTEFRDSATQDSSETIAITKRSGRSLRALWKRDEGKRDEEEKEQEAPTSGRGNDNRSRNEGKAD